MDKLRYMRKSKVASFKVEKPSFRMLKPSSLMSVQLEFMIAQYASFQLTQGIFAHHTFRLVCPAESIDGTTGNVFNQSKNLIGATLTAQVASIGTAGLLTGL
ncbi:MAG: hypothetical protein EOO85_31410, partial [Pedobacter sp.]